MSKIKFNKYIPNKENLKKKKEILKNKDLKYKKRKAKIIFLKIFIKLISISFILSIIAGIFYLIYIKNIFNINEYFHKLEFKNLLSAENQILENDNNNNLLLKDFQNRLLSQGIESSTSTVNSDGDIVFYIKNSYKDEGYIILNKDYNDINYVWNVFLSSMSSPDLKEKVKNNLKNLEYIDLRFENKVFYKFYNQENATSTEL